MGGRDSCRDFRPHSRYRALFVDDELTPDVRNASRAAILCGSFDMIGWREAELRQVQAASPVFFSEPPASNAIHAAW